MKKYALGLYEKAMPDTLHIKEKLMAAKEAGYDYLELCIDASEEKISRVYMSQEERLQIVSWMTETGIPIRSMSVSALTKYSLGNPDPEKEKRGMEIAEKAMDLAADLGIRMVMLPGYDVFYEASTYETKKRYVRNIRIIAEYAEVTGVLLGFETMENEFMNTVQKALKYVTLSNSNYMKIYPDIGNLTNAAVLYQQDVLEDLSLGKGNLLALHLKETLPGRFREVPFGAGHVDFAGAIKTAWELGIRRYVTEFWYVGNPEWKRELKETYDRFNRILQVKAQNG